MSQETLDQHNEDVMPPTISWAIRIPIFKNPLILKQLGLAIGIPFGVIILVLLLTARKVPYIYYALGIIGALLVLTTLIIFVIFRGTYDVEFILDSKGVRGKMQEDQARKSGTINKMAILLGLFARNYSAAGAGALAQSRQEQTLAWGRVRKIAYNPKSRMISLKAGLGDTIVLFCTEDNYASVEQYVRAKIAD
ncbi:MAG: hypothetical protein GX850_02405 [Clostridiaceae bacterium]|jgi:hypothetical protein|nr:hypothetical protein [Clostridiaceae bacterium]